MAGAGKGSQVDRRTTPSLIRKKQHAKRSRKQLKAKRSAEKPSWKSALRRKYLEADAARRGGFVDDRSWKKRQLDAKSQRELAQVRRKRQSGTAGGSDDEGAGDEEEEEEYDFGEELEKGKQDGVEVQDDIDEDKMKRLNESDPLANQLFLKGLPQAVDESELRAHLRRFGAVKNVFVVKHKLTGMATGSAFVHFESNDGAKTMLEHAKQNSLDMAADLRDDRTAATDGLSRHKAKELMHKLKHQQTVSRDPFFHFGQTRVTVHEPMDRVEAQEFIGAMHKGGKKAKRTPVGADDPRNLYLLREGLIEADTPAAKGLPPNHLQMLLRDYEERKQQLKNVNYFVSKTRLSIRNLPKTVESGQLRKLFIEKAKAFYKANPTQLDKTKWSKHGPVKQCRVLVDAKGQSKRFGFVELIDHDVALYCLRMINNNPELYGPNSRPVVTFAVENANALQKLQRIRDLRKEREDQQNNSSANTGEAGASGDQGSGQPQSYRELAMQERRAMQQRHADGGRGGGSGGRGGRGGFGGRGGSFGGKSGPGAAKSAKKKGARKNGGAKAGKAPNKKKGRY